MALISDLDDRTLVEQHRAGDPDAFRRIVLRHHRSLYANALRRLNDPVAAEDAVQDAFLRAYRSIERFDGDYHLDAWLHRIVTNTCHDIGRRRGRDTRLFDRACTEVETEVAPADEGLDAMPREQIADALDSLPESYREVLVLRFVEELSYADVAEQAGISEENARARVSRGRTMLKRMLTSTSALVVWAIPPLRRQAQLGGAEAEAANQAAAQVHGLAQFTTIATSAPAPTQAFTQVSGFLAQAGPAIATAAPAVSSTAPTFGKAAVAVGLAAAAAIPAGVAVDRARETPKEPVAQSVDESAVASLDAPVVVETPAEPTPPKAAASTPVQALSVGGDESTITDVSPSTTVASTSTSVPPTTDTAPSTSTPPATEGETATPSPTPAPAPTDEQPTEEPAPAPAPAPAADPGQLSATLDVATVGDQLHVTGPLSLAIGDSTFAGQLTGKLMLGPVDAKGGAREVLRSTLRLDLESGARLELTIYGMSTVTRQGNTETHDLDLRFMLPGGADLGLAEDGQLEGTLVVKQGAGDLGLALPGAPADS